MTTVRAVSDLVAVSAAIALTDCDSRSDEPPGSLVMDWKHGTYEGVRLGDHSAKLRQILGRPLTRGPHEPFEPVDEDFYEIGGLTNFDSPELSGSVGDIEALRYRRRVFATTADRVSAWGTTDQRARTPEGVGIGDELALVERRYAGADCFIQNRGTEYPEYPLCKVRVCAGRLLRVRRRADQEHLAGGRDDDWAGTLPAAAVIFV